MIKTMAHTFNTNSLNTIVRTSAVTAYIAYARAQKSLSESEIVALIAKGDDASKNKVIESYSLFMLSFASKFAKGDEVLELISCATIGMKKAMESFDASRGTKFISYAVHYMYMEISKYFREVAPMIRRASDAKISSKATRISDKFFAVNGRYPSEEEIVDSLKDEFGLEASTSDVVLIRVSSMDSKVSSDEDSEVASEVGEIAVSTASRNEFLAEEEKEHNAYLVSKMLRVLTPMERNVISMVYGVDGNETAHELDDVAERYGLTAERVRQIKVGAERKLAMYGKKIVASM